MLGILINGVTLLHPKNREWVESQWQIIKESLGSFLNDTKWQSKIDWDHFFNNYENRFFRAELFGTSNELMNLGYADNPKDDHNMAISLMMFQLQQLQRFGELVDYFMRQACFQPSLGTKNLLFLLRLSNSAQFTEFLPSQRFMQKLAKGYFEYLLNLFDHINLNNFDQPGSKLFEAIDEMFGYWAKFLEHLENEQVDRQFRYDTVIDILDSATKLETKLQELEKKHEVIPLINRDTKMRKTIKLIGAGLVKMIIAKERLVEIIDGLKKCPAVKNSFCKGAINQLTANDNYPLAEKMLLGVLDYLPKV